MSIGVIVEVGIGILFVWVMLALITSQVSDWVASWLKWRANMLETTIQNMLGCKDIFADFYSHPLIKGLYSNRGNRRPSYIPKNQFALVVFDVFLKAGTDESVVLDQANAIEEKAEPIISQLKHVIQKFKQTPGSDKEQIARAIETLLLDVSMASKKVQDADDALAEARKRMESWFDNAMERLSGAYKRRLQLASIIIGLVVAAMINADSLAIAESLWTQPIVREAIVAQAEQFQLPEEQDVTPEEQILEYAGTFQGFSIPIGWATENIPTDFEGWFLKVGGIALSGVAAAQGAPFWFEILRKLLNFRSNSSPKKEDN